MEPAMTDEPEFDPTAPLSGPPEPWSYGSPPSHRAGPPWHMTDMIAAEPALAGRIITRVVADGGATALAEAIRRTVAQGAPIVVTGCGTSETAGTGVVAILREALRAAGTPRAQVVSEQAFELSLDPPARGLVIALSHEGGTAATIAALRASSAAGARTALLTVSRRSPAGQIAEIVIETAELDQSWCHTIGYVSPMLAAAAVGAELSGRSLDGNAVAELLAAGARDEGGAERIASALASSDRLLVIASGADRAAGRELALKLEEACWLPSAYRDLETLLHGHLPAAGAETGLVLVLVDRAGRAERLQRARQALSAARVIGIRSAAILDADLDGELDAGLTPAGRLRVRPDSSLPASVAALFATAAPLQLLTERFARARGTNPDLIRRDDPVYLRASEATGG
jgi:glutamine---fructose-6-phosphate transaminase (isomerizing)